MTTTIIDPDRQRAARTRALLAIHSAKHHERMALAERAKAAQIARTWELHDLLLHELDKEAPSL